MTHESSPLEALARALRQGEGEKVAALVEASLAAGSAPAVVLESGLIAGMREVGELFRRREIFLPDVLLAAKAMEAGMTLLKPRFLGGTMPTSGKVVLGTVRGDVHDIGKNLVGVMLQGAGFQVIDLGKDVPAERFVETAAAEGAPVIGMSALLTTTMPVMREVVDLLSRRGLAGKIRTIIGGAPASEEYAREIGADAYGYDAHTAVERIRQLVKET